MSCLRTCFSSIFTFNWYILYVACLCVFVCANVLFSVVLIFSYFFDFSFTVLFTHFIGIFNFYKYVCVCVWATLRLVNMFVYAISLSILILYHFLHGIFLYRFPLIFFFCCFSFRPLAFALRCCKYEYMTQKWKFFEQSQKICFSYRFEFIGIASTLTHD